MKLITSAIQKKLEKNYETQNDSDVALKLFNPCGGQVWLITQIEPNNDTMWGLCDLGMGCAEYGTVSLSELTSQPRSMRFMLERDMYFHGGTVDSFREYYDEHNTLRGC